MVLHVVSFLRTSYAPQYFFLHQSAQVMVKWTDKLLFTTLLPIINKQPWKQ